MDSKYVDALIYLVLIYILLCVNVTEVLGTDSSAKSTNIRKKDDNTLSSKSNQLYPTIVTDSNIDADENDIAERGRVRIPVNIFDSGNRKESRRFNIFSGLWNRVRSSPLYLVNGTVCRSVNGLPICTTLATTGLVPSTGGGGSGSTARPPTQGIQSGGSSVQFADTSSNTNVMSVQTQSPIRSVPQNQESNQERPRPAVMASSTILQDDSQDINVASVKNINSTANADIVRQAQIPQVAVKPQIVTQNTRPLAMLSANRRPLNLMAFRRPVSFQHQVI